MHSTGLTDVVSWMMMMVVMVMIGFEMAGFASTLVWFGTIKRDLARQVLHSLSKFRSCSP